MKLGDVLKLVGEVAIDEKIAEQQLHESAPGDLVVVDLPHQGQLEWADGHRHFAVEAITVRRKQ